MLLPGSGELIFSGIVALFLLLFVCAVVFIVVSAVRSRRVLREAGLDPLTAQAQIAARFANGPLAAPNKTLEQRLSELEDLRARGVISEIEYATSRAAVLVES